MARLRSNGDTDHRPVVRCRMCGRKLTGEMSTWAKIGPTCAMVLIVEMDRDRERRERERRARAER
jgi:Family of unknown function (DUF6011)